MAKSKLIRSNKKIEKCVVNGYKKIENGVVISYKKLENSVVEGFTKITDIFVDWFLTRDGENIEAAKKRLAEEQEIHKKGNR